jgi:hypothetical protein
MENKAIVYSYWRSIKRGIRTFESVKNNNITSVSSLANDIYSLAIEDVKNNIITKEEFKLITGEEFEE